jgi:hypothetical protein
MVDQCLGPINCEKDQHRSVSFLRMWRHPASVVLAQRRTAVDTLGGGGKCEEAFWQAMVVDSHAESKPRLAPEQCDEIMSVLLLLDEPPEESPPSRNESDVLILQIPRVLANSMNNLSMNKESITSPLPQALVHALHGQSFFTTRSGYIGVGPGSTQARDQMFVLTGGA